MFFCGKSWPNAPFSGWELRSHTGCAVALQKALAFGVAANFGCCCWSFGDFHYQIHIGSGALPDPWVLDVASGSTGSWPVSALVRTLAGALRFDHP